MANVEVIKKLPKLSEWNMSEMIKFSENTARELRINMTQIRKFHGHISKIWSKYSMNRPSYLKNLDAFKREIRDEMIFVKAYLAYQTGRQDELRDLQDILGTAIDKINDQADFELFKKFYDSILAYFKYYESQKGGQRR
ncbi:MAG TPA: type III-A CRISPR-associated protein Csm2 [Pseudothermotoga sp.]|uniref:type III-A CRISPR-associated protein Csm2 n=1 Tax=Thermotoga profunda TaxID=1508420 RepID=UPI000693AFDC|nr:type III-A CRISPR-associated protein Csm2 [Thermotoga profunda]